MVDKIKNKEEFSLNDFILKAVNDGKVTDESLIKALINKEQELIELKKQEKRQALIDNLKNSQNSRRYIMM